MITITGLHKSYGGRRVLDGLDLIARPGEVTLLVGANGCGKTTTLRHLCGLSAPDAGQIVIGSADLTTARMAALAQLSFLPQSPRFHARLTVAEILRFYARLRGLLSGRGGGGQPAQSKCKLTHHASRITHHASLCPLPTHAPERAQVL